MISNACARIASHQFARVAFAVMPKLCAIKGNKSSCVLVPFLQTTHISSSSLSYWIKFNKNEKIYSRYTLAHSYTHPARDKFSVETFLPRLNYSTRFVFFETDTLTHTSVLRLFTHAQQRQSERRK